MYENVSGSASCNVVQKSSEDYTDLLAKPPVSSVMAYICVFTVAATVIKQQWTFKYSNDFIKSFASFNLFCRGSPPASLIPPSGGSLEASLCSSSGLYPQSLSWLPLDNLIYKWNFVWTRFQIPLETSSVCESTRTCGLKLTYLNQL